MGRSGTQGGFEPEHSTNPTDCREFPCWRTAPMSRENRPTAKRASDDGPSRVDVATLGGSRHRPKIQFSQLESRSLADSLGRGLGAAN